MKNMISLGILIAILSVQVTAQSTGQITIEKKGLKKTYLQDEQALTSKELVSVLKSNQESAKAFQASRTNSIISLASMTTGTVFIGAGLVYTIKAAQATNDGDLGETTDYSAQSSVCMLAGALFYGASIPFILMANRHLNRSIDLYNSSLSDKTTDQLNLYFGFTENGIGIQLRF